MPGPLLRTNGPDAFSPLTELEPEELPTTWRVFTKVKNSLVEGSRLENLSWRLWFLHQMIVTSVGGDGKDVLQKVGKGVVRKFAKDDSEPPKDKDTDAEIAKEEDVSLESSSSPTSQMTSIYIPNSGTSSNAQAEPQQPVSSHPVATTPNAEHTQQQKSEDDWSSFIVTSSDSSQNATAQPAVTSPIDPQPSAPQAFPNLHNLHSLNLDVLPSGSMDSTFDFLNMDFSIPWDWMLSEIGFGNDFASPIDTSPAAVQSKNNMLSTNAAVPSSLEQNISSSIQTSHLSEQESRFEPVAQSDPTSTQKCHSDPECVSHQHNVTSESNSIIKTTNKPKKLPSAAPRDEKMMCSNCGVTSTPLWRRSDQDELLCNACGLYLKLHHQPRPLNLRPNLKSKDGAELAGPPPTCHNCATTNTPLWRRNDEGHVLCNACGLYYKLHSKARPLHMKTDVIKKRTRERQAASSAQAPSQLNKHSESSRRARKSAQAKSDAVKMETFTDDSTVRPKYESRRSTSVEDKAESVQRVVREKAKKRKETERETTENSKKMKVDPRNAALPRANSSQPSTSLTINTASYVGQTLPQQSIVQSPYSTSIAIPQTQTNPYFSQPMNSAMSGQSSGDHISPTQQSQSSIPTQSFSLTLPQSQASNTSLLTSQFTLPNPVMNNFSSAATTPNSVINLPSYNPSSTPGSAMTPQLALPLDLSLGSLVSVNGSYVWFVPTPQDNLNDGNVNRNGNL